MATINVPVTHALRGLFRVAIKSAREAGHGTVANELLWLQQDLGEVRAAMGTERERAAIAIFLATWVD